MEAQTNTEHYEPSEGRMWFATITACVISLAFALICIYTIGEYGVALFILVPILLGFTATTLYCYNRPVTWKQAKYVGFYALLMLSLVFFLFALEGLICMVMAAPFGLLFTWIGNLLGYEVTKKHPQRTTTVMLVLVCLIPFTAFTEREVTPKVAPVITSVVIDADIATVWKNVVAFPKLDPPEEFLFKVGISYPIESRIEGQGKGAIRYCTFNSGDFIEPITIWEENSLLAFDVLEQPEPLKELSFWDVNSPHLHDYFISKRGQFKLEQLEDGKVLLEGTTWYYHNIKPDIYWRLWSNLIIHQIHNRVLDHIKAVSESEQ